MALSIALAEDNSINRHTFLQKIKQFPEINLRFSAVNGNDFLHQLKGLPYALHPQVVFMDLEMPEMDGIQTIQIAKALYPHISFIVLTVFDDEEKILEAIKAGAGGYLLKDEGAESIRGAITNVIEFGGAPMSPAIARKVLQLLGKGTNITVHADAGNEMDAFLSSREKEILHHIVQGYDSKRIAEILGISVLTVRKHVANIYQRLQVNSKAQIISLAHQRKWV